MSEQPHDAARTWQGSRNIEELARVQHAEQVADVEELAADIWGSDEELDEFLTDLRASRNASLA